VALEEVPAERFLSALAVLLAAASARCASAFPDDPDGGAVPVFFEVEVGAFTRAGHWQASSIAAIADSVTTSLPATFDARKRPLSISVLSDLAVTVPPGKNRAAASSRL
jgi:hypothetical protein